MDTPSEEPKPKSNVTTISSKREWQATSVLKEVRLPMQSEKTFDEVFEERRTRRVISEVPLRETLAFVKHVFAPRHLGRGAMEGRTRKTVISAGALHPIDVLIVDGPEITEPVLYAERHNKFLTLPVLNPDGFGVAVDDAKQVQSLATGHLILFVGDLKRVSRSYSAPQSLLWKDSGAAAQACSSAAHAYGYGYCPLGINGRDILASLGPPDREYVAVGLGVFGR